MPQRPVLLLQNGVQVDPAGQRPLVQTVPQVPELQSGMVGKGDTAGVFVTYCALTLGIFTKLKNTINNNEKNTR
ncbi:hypothetical protein KBC80_02730 [Candidatus Woesebacteria bacterium]|nr:hypothetical protein [Candidatus Woesebacteria bacterium]